MLDEDGYLTINPEGRGGGGGSVITVTTNADDQLGMTSKELSDALRSGSTVIYEVPDGEGEICQANLLVSVGWYDDGEGHNVYSFNFGWGIGFVGIGDDGYPTLQG